MNRLFATSLCLVTTIALHAQEPEGASKAKTVETKGDLSATAFSKTGMTGSSVGIALEDNKVRLAHHRGIHIVDRAGKNLALYQRVALRL